MRDSEGHESADTPFVTVNARETDTTDHESPGSGGGGAPDGPDRGEGEDCEDPNRYVFGNGVSFRVDCGSGDLDGYAGMNLGYGAEEENNEGTVVM